jgi:hypothetical protein
MEKGWTLLRKFALPIHAELAKQMLVSNGIEAVVFNKRDSTFLSFGAIELYVNDHDLNTATELIDQQGFDSDLAEENPE